ncbi:phosphotriesterase [Dactylosporangium sucinum]|uniref:Aryldialkylphosphatase n=1 Tax=Dactylosporangium sucinum TaxID=1424081 RepID=A0A917UA15_9ACTN|nr:phosphotriesterase-related protein [Dactylosporangium sucinum]GGM69479.1 aryldialkylphosphatase [Dactylosporangium sucinum]
MTTRQGSVQTVTGLMDPADLGITHSHEHVMWDYFQMIRSYDVIFDDENVATEEVRLFAAAGGGSLVDCTTTGLGPQPEALRRISEATGVNIILGCGWYREPVYVPEVSERTSRELGEILVRHITEGFEGTDVKAGFIGEIGTERHHISPREERVFRAAAYASTRTGAPIWTHTTHFGELAQEQIDLLEECGVQPESIVVNHLGDREDTDHLLAIARRGVYMSIDNIGYSGEGYPSDDVRFRSIEALVEAGFEDRVMLGTDVGTRAALKTYGGRGFAWLIESFIPLMRDRGLDPALIEKLTVHNVARALTIA